MTDLTFASTSAFRSGTAAQPLVAVDVAPGADAALDTLAALSDRRHRFLRAAWFRAAPAKALRTLIARRPSGEPFAALPIEARSAFLKSVPGSYWPIRCFPLAPDAGEAELVAFLSDRSARRALGPVWRLGPVRADGPTASRLLPIAGAAGWTVLTRSLGTAFILDLAALRREGPWPKSATLRKNRNLERRLSEEGELDYRQLGGPDWTAELFDTLAAVEGNSWIASKTDGADAKFLSPKHRNFWERVAADPAIAARMQASLLYVGGVPAAFAFYLSAGRFAYLIANSYDERFRRHSPGRILLYRDFERLADSGVECVDWGAGDPGYKSEMGARPGPAILDHLFVRSPLLARLIRPLWRG